MNPVLADVFGEDEGLVEVGDCGSDDASHPKYRRPLPKRRKHGDHSLQQSAQRENKYEERTRKSKGKPEERLLRNKLVLFITRRKVLSKEN